MIGDHLDVIALSETETVLKLTRGSLVVEGLWKGNPKHAAKLLPRLRQVLHEQWKKGPPPGVLPS